MDYICLQHYWWFIISLLAGLLVLLLFVQGGQSMLFSLGRTALEQKMLTNSTGRKWEFTFTTLVTFGGAFFASFPLFYSTSFGGAYWLWMMILFSFVIQAVSYEFQSHMGNILGKKTYQVFLIINGIAAPILLGVAVATFFTGSEFIVNKDQITNITMPVISSWTNPLHGLEALGNGWNLCLGIAVFFLSRLLALLYFINNIDDYILQKRFHKALYNNTALFLLFFLTFIVHLFWMDGFAVEPQTQVVFMQPNKYLINLFEMPAVAASFVIGVLLVLGGILTSMIKHPFKHGIWFTGIGTVVTVLSLLLLAGYNNTAYYPSTSDLQSSLTLTNSSSSLFTLETMGYVSLFIPFVLGYIFYAWRAIDLRSISAEEMEDKNGHNY